MKQLFAISIFLCLHLQNLNAQFTSGSFLTPQSFTSGTSSPSNPITIGSADLNADGKRDVITCNLADNTISVFQNTTTIPSPLTFATKIDYYADTYPLSVATGDIDNDGKPEVTNGSMTTQIIRCYPNNSSGSGISLNVSSLYGFTSSSQQVRVAMADLNSDDYSDIIAINYDTDEIEIILSDGSGGFSTQFAYATGAGPITIATADLDGDNDLDIVIGNTAGSVTIYENTTTSSFSLNTTPTTITCGINNKVCIADVNADGFSDIIGTNSSGNTIHIILHSGTGMSFSTSTVDITGNNPQGLAVIDMDADGKKDLVVANTGLSSVSIYRNIYTNGTFSSSSFASRVDYAVGGSGVYPSELIAEDFNRDGMPDVAVTFSDPCNYFQILINEMPNQIVIAPNMVYALYPYYTIPSIADPKRLFDEQSKISSGSSAQACSTSIGPFSTTSNYDYMEDYSVLVDLSKVYDLAYYDYYDYGSDEGYFKIYAWNQSTHEWDLIDNFQANSANGWYTRYLSSVQRTQYLKFRFLATTNHTNTNKWATIKEIKLYGCPQNGSTPSTPTPDNTVYADVDQLMSVDAGFWHSTDRLKGQANMRYFLYSEWGDACGNGSAISCNQTSNTYRFGPGYYYDGGPRNMDNKFTEWDLAGLDVTSVLVHVPQWMTASSSTIVAKPIVIGSTTKNFPAEWPGNYLPHSEYLYKYTARYGNGGASVDVSKTDNPVKSMNKMHYVENWNEPNQWWIGMFQSNEGQKARDAYFSGLELAAMSSADYDAHNTPSVYRGVKNADDNVKMAMAGLATIDLDYIKVMNIWSTINRTSGSRNFPADVLNFHHYANSQGASMAGDPICPEEDSLMGKMTDIVTYRNSYLKGKEIWLSEFGYGSGNNPTSNHVDVPVITGVSKEETQARWMMRSFLILAASGIDRAYWYQLDDEKPPEPPWTPGQFYKCGLNEWQGTPKIAAFYYQIMRNTLTGFHYNPSGSSVTGNVYKYKFANSTGKVIYVLWRGTANNGVEPTPYSLSGLAVSGMKIRMITPNVGTGISTCLSNSASITITELPVFITYEPVYNTNISSSATLTAGLTNVREEIHGTITINGSSITISGSQFDMFANSEILVTNGAVLTINNSVFTSCEQWKGIYVDPNSSLIINGTTIRDASIAVYANEPDYLEVTGCLFFNNWLSVAINNNVSGTVNVSDNVFSTMNFDGNTYTYSTPDGRAQYGSGTNFYINISASANSANPALFNSNEFNGINLPPLSAGTRHEVTAIGSQNSDFVTIADNTFNGGALQEIDRAIDASGNYNTKMLKIVGSTSTLHNIFNSTNRSIIISNYMSYKVHRNMFNYVNTGVESYNDNYTASNNNRGIPMCSITDNDFWGNSADAGGNPPKHGTTRGIVIAPIIDPFGGIASWSINSLAITTPPQEHKVAIICNRFNDVAYGITGAGDMRDLFLYGTGSEYAGNEWRQFDGNNNEVWDLKWIDNTSSPYNPWNYYCNSNIYNKWAIPDHTNRTFVTPAILPTLNGVTITSSFTLSNYVNIVSSTSLGGPYLCYQYPIAENEFNSPPSPPIFTSTFNINESRSIILYPNPFENQLSITLVGVTDQDINIDIKDITGKSISNQKVCFTGGIGLLNFEKAGNLKPGVYILSIKVNDNLVVRKIVKQ